MEKRERQVEESKVEIHKTNKYIDIKKLNLRTLFGKLCNYF